jgi:hypothetical protein
VLEGVAEGEEERVIGERYLQRWGLVETVP